MTQGKCLNFPSLQISTQHGQVLLALIQLSNSAMLLGEKSYLIAQKNQFKTTVIIKIKNEAKNQNIYLQIENLENYFVFFLPGNK